MRMFVGLILGVVLLSIGGWLRWCPNPPFGEQYADEAGTRMLGEMGIVLLVLGTYLVGHLLSRWFSPSDW